MQSKCSQNAAKLQSKVSQNSVKIQSKLSLSKKFSQNFFTCRTFPKGRILRKGDSSEFKMMLEIGVIRCFESEQDGFHQGFDCEVLEL